VRRSSRSRKKVVYADEAAVQLEVSPNTAASCAPACRIVVCSERATAAFVGAQPYQPDVVPANDICYCAQIKRCAAYREAHAQDSCV
jgi:hypothetical protein